MTEDLRLFPRPREVNILGEARPITSVRMEHKPDTAAESYEIDVEDGGVTIRFADARGELYGTQTWQQIAEQGPVPDLYIRDRPDVPVRGYMLDISRDRVPTRDTLERVVDLLELARFNHLQLYTEHTFAYAGHDVVWEHASPMTADDVRWLDGLCAERGIELVANQNSFGHMERWLSHEPYRDRAECPDGFELLGRTRPPSTLAPTPSNAEFSLALLRELLGCHTSGRVNIGCDETWELGRCRSADAVAERGRAAVFAEHLRRLAGPLVTEGYQVLFWADMIRTHPELIEELPADVRPVAWTYEQPRTAEQLPDLPEPVRKVVEEAGISLAAHMGFAGNVAPLADAGIGFWVAPGTSTWNSLIGRVDNAYANIADACGTAARHGCEGLLLTDWGDNGHLQPPSVSFGPIVYAGAMSWCAETNRDVDVASVLDGYVFGDDAGVLGGVLDRIGRLWGRTGQRAFNASPLQAALCPHQPHLVTGPPDSGAVERIAAELTAALESLGGARPTCADAEAVLGELDATIRLARQGAWRLAGRDRSELDRELDALIEEHRLAWALRSRPGGLDDSAGQLERTLARS